MGSMRTVGPVRSMRDSITVFRIVEIHLQHKLALRRNNPRLLLRQIKAIFQRLSSFGNTNSGECSCYRSEREEDFLFIHGAFFSLRTQRKTNPKTNPNPDSTTPLISISILAFPVGRGFDFPTSPGLFSTRRVDVDTAEVSLSDQIGVDGVRRLSCGVHM